MENTFKCGLIKVGATESEPDWAEFAERIGFAQMLGVNAIFLNSFKNEQGDWVVPFFSAEDSMGRFAKADQVLSSITPYEIVGIKTIDVSAADLETIKLLSALVPEPAETVLVSDVKPGMHTNQIHDVEDAFSGLIGMETQKELFSKMATARAKHGPKAIDSFHFVFEGAPGTGKTELASRVPAILDYLGITDGSGRYVKVGEADIVAKYVGHTAPKIRRAVQSALGGCLHIDEAYAIMNAPYFGQEAVDALVDQLDTHRHEFVCIMSGYTDEMETLLDANAGLRDRFSFKIPFSDYTANELADIFENMAKDRGFDVGNRDSLVACTKQLMKSKGFSNARTMRKLLDHAIMEAASSHDEAILLDEDLLEATQHAFTKGATHTVGF